MFVGPERTAAIGEGKARSRSIPALGNIGQCGGIVKHPIRWLAAFVAVLLLFCAMPAESKTLKPQARESLRLLTEGNARFAAGKPLHPRQGEARRAEVAPGQHPFAIIISCSDSRVPPEILFDQGIGDLFVVRVAGNVLDDMILGSVGYGASHLGIPLVVVLGHKRCGAVTVAVGGGEVPDYARGIVDELKPAVDEARKSCKDGDLVEAASHANVRRVVQMLRKNSPVLARLIRAGELSVVGAYYDLDSGKVEFLRY